MTGVTTSTMLTHFQVLTTSYTPITQHKHTATYAHLHQLLLPGLIGQLRGGLVQWSAIRHVTNGQLVLIDDDVGVWVMIVTTRGTLHNPAKAKNNNNNNNSNNNRIQRRNSRVFTISSLRHELSPTHTPKWPGCNRVQITCNTSRAYHVQHAMLRTTCHVGTAQLFSLTEFKITFIWALFYWLNH